MKITRWIYAGTLLTFIALAACEDDDNENESMDLQETDEMFVENVALSNMTEMQFGSLAASKGSDSLVRAYGSMMVSEHTTAQQELQTQAGNFDNVEWPEQMDQSHQDIYQQLMQLQGYSFDSLYINSQVDDHQATLDIFEQETSDGENDQVKAYARKYQPHIQEHLDMADSINNVLMNQDGN
jgi:putative membrane protein